MPQHLMPFMLHEQSRSGEETYSLRQAAIAIGRAYITVYAWAIKGRFPTTRSGRTHYVSREDLSAFAESIGIDPESIGRRPAASDSFPCRSCGSPIESATPRVFCDKRCESDWNRARIPVDRDWLEEKYIHEGIDANAIGRIVGRDGKTVWSWLKMHGIPTRSRGKTGNGEWWKQGKPSPFQGKRHSPETRKRMSDRAKAEGRVPYDPAVGSYMKGRKGADTTNWKGGITPERQSFYSSSEWKAAVKVVWKRDHAACQRCGKRNSKGQRYTFDIHHIVSFACKELRADPSNLVLLCESCHYWVHSRENVGHLYLGEILNHAC